MVGQSAWQGISAEENPGGTGLYPDPWFSFGIATVLSTDPCHPRQACPKNRVHPGRSGGLESAASRARRVGMFRRCKRDRGTGREGARG
jgi:hypothetical protein